MKIRLISDVHFEFYEDKELYQNKGEDVLVIAGDLAVGFANVQKALTRFRSQTDNVIYVPGNHEYYEGYVDIFDTKISTFLQYTYGIHFLNPGTIKLGDITFIGATLWTNFRNDHWASLMANDMISDFKVIRGFRPNHAIELFYKHYQYIKTQYEAIEGKKVIVTHFLPAIECIHPRFRNQSQINYYFANDLGDWISEMEEVTWLFGHTHDSMDIMLGDTRVVCNPYGYNKNENYKELIIEV